MLLKTSKKSKIYLIPVPLVFIKEFILKKAIKYNIKKYFILNFI